MSGAQRPTGIAPSKIPACSRDIRDWALKGEALTPRELVILRGYALGLSGPEIAASIERAPGTIKHYNKSILSKLGARRMPQAVGIAVSLDLV